MRGVPNNFHLEGWEASMLADAMAQQEGVRGMAVTDGESGSLYRRLRQHSRDVQGHAPRPLGPRGEAARALDTYKIAAQDLSEALSVAGISDIVNYPGYLPSFDEHAVEVTEMRLLPDGFSADQCSALGNLASEQVTGFTVPGQVYAVKADFAARVTDMLAKRLRRPGDEVATVEADDMVVTLTAYDEEENIDRRTIFVYAADGELKGTWEL